MPAFGLTAGPLVPSATGIAPSALCSDEEYLRRASLDSIGTLPTPEEVQSFIADKDPDKRDKLVDRLLERNEYASYWANQWGDLLRVKRGGNDGLKAGTFAFSGWLRNAFAQNMPYDQFAKAILTAQGESAENPPVNWYRHVRNTVAMVNDSHMSVVDLLAFSGNEMTCPPLKPVPLPPKSLHAKAARSCCSTALVVSSPAAALFRPG